MLRLFAKRNLPVVKEAVFGSNPCRLLSSQDMQSQQTDGEKKIIATLKSKFPQASAIDVSDISGGCGAMYQIAVESSEFKGKRTIQQHRLVNEALADEIKDMHGLQITTKVPDL